MSKIHKETINKIRDNLTKIKDRGMIDKGSIEIILSLI